MAKNTVKLAIMKFLIPHTKPRSASHRALFDREQPYRPKTERRRDRYTRHCKNQRQHQEHWGDDSR
jgi:hypothetical protein